MGRISTMFSLVMALGLSAVGFAQGGQGGYAGTAQDSEQRLIAEKTDAIGQYLYGPELKSVLTPGETVEWKLDFKAGQVLFAEARSDAFDPALEVVDSKDKVYASNDDRYPGDQRPLLMWRCEQAGTYKLRVRCFHDKSGGQVFVKFHTIQSYDLGSGEMAEHEVNTAQPFLLRISMKKGEIRELTLDTKNGQFFFPQVSQVISPTGLPDIGLAGPIWDQGVPNVLMAPVAGDYYFLANSFNQHIPRHEVMKAGFGKSMNMGGQAIDSTEVRLGKIHVGTREILPQKLALESGSAIGKGNTSLSNVWELDLKAGQFFEASADGLNKLCSMNLAVMPDISGYDLSDPEKNPFFPRLPEHPDQGSPFEDENVRANDPRATAFFVRRDTKLWLVVRGGADVRDKSLAFDLQVKPAAASFETAKDNTGQLKIGRTNWWGYEAKTGDVMTMTFQCSGYVQNVSLRNTDMGEDGRFTNGDEGTLRTTRIIQRPGRYYLAMSCIGDSGSGSYTLKREVIPAREFGPGSPAKAEIKDGQVQVWKFTAKPGQPLMLHWKTLSGRFNVDTYDDKGEGRGIGRDAVDGHNAFGIIHVDKPTTFVLVFTGASSYELELTPLLGGK